jgi:histidinol-phosphate phosphatase family protein
MPGSKAIFLDRDGTVSVEMGYIHEEDIPRYALNPGAAKGMKRMQGAGYKLIIVTNQSGVARGYYPLYTVDLVHQRLRELLGKEGVSLDALYYCPHHANPTGPADSGEMTTPGRVGAKPVPELSFACECRKPMPGMGLQAVREHNLDLSQSWMIGDKNGDMGFAKNLGLKPILVTSGYGAQTLERLKAKGETPAHVAADLNEAADIILGHS